MEVDTGIGAGGGARCSPLFGSSSPCLCSFLMMFQMILRMMVRIAHLLLLVGAAWSSLFHHVFVVVAR